MSECCAPRRAVEVEVKVLRVDGETCERCNASVTNARRAVDELAQLLSPLGVAVELVETPVTADDLAASNSVVVNGRPVEDWLGAARVSTECASCGDLCGDESVCCGALAVDGEVFESYSVEHIREATMRALGAQLAAGGSCCG